ncbi:hypothetical protein Micbo1qcDRAFT_167352 [Microdochium bolleyi]|uniref:CFEM domain-containing protein n=1 Tax=Microdochium bolleyi TaxID=196109 RepID=A0A136IS50_9PEZI|nr:hypothetical protein Micbo1qcDRAFT_167352 [Microdochium bolleyi]
MQFKTLAVSLFIASATAATIQELVASIPKCAQTCINKAAEQVGCKKDDPVCQCKKADEITAAGTTCVATSCTDIADLTKTLEISTEICKMVAAGAAAGTAPAGTSSGAPAASTSKAASGTPTVTPTPTRSASGTASSTPTAGAGRNGVALGLAAAAVAMAL